MERQEILDKHRQFLFPCVANYYEEPVVLTEGRGSQVKDVDGREYLDFFGGILTVSLGHCQPEVVEAIAEQSRRLGHTSTLYPTENLVRAAERMARLTPGELKQSFFCNSGTEADETAIQIAKVYTGQHEIIALRHAYSGRSALALTVTAHSNWRALPAAVAGVVHGHPAYCYRCPFGQTYPSCDIRCATDLEELVQTVTTGKPAAFMAEPIQGVGGFIVPPPEYFQVAVGIVRKYGGVFICDEVQTGFGRTGDKWFGIEHWGVEPEIMTFAKGIANGMPVGAVIAKPEIASALGGLSLSTYGGNPVSMAAMNATLDVMEREDVPARAARLGKLLRERLEAFKERFAFIGDVRGMGLMQGLEIVKDPKTKEPDAKRTARFMEATREERVLVGVGGLYGNVVRIGPSLLVTKDEIAEGVEKLARAADRAGD
jgi:4-aminobutyrate aminotransferase-like enzyme